MSRLRSSSFAEPSPTKPRRHRWGDKAEFAHKSERACIHGCGIIKTTRHEGGQHWIEYWRGLDRISTGKTPSCEKVEVDA